jgi:hypothetical protein
MKRTAILGRALALVALVLAAIVALSLAYTSAPAARARANSAVTPKSGQTLPSGTDIAGVCLDNSTPPPTCDPDTGCAAGTTLVNDVTGTDLEQEVPAGSGTWIYDSTFDSSAGCDKVIDTLGSYRLVIMRAYFTQTSDGQSGWDWSDEQDTTRYVAFTIGAGEPCDDEGAIKDVWSQSGSDHGLTGMVLRNGQTITADERIELTLGDDSVIRLDKGSRLTISCKDLSSGSTRSWRESIGLSLGKVWAKIAKPFDNDYKIHTDRAVTGLRGTYFWLSYVPARKLTTAHTILGKVALTNSLGKPKVTVTVQTGRTATQQGNAPPRLVSH